MEFHYTPKHGSWLNVAECELAVLATQCLDRRLPDLATVAREVAAWEARRNRERPTIKWHFTTVQARRKLRHLYPHPESSMWSSSGAVRSLSDATDRLPNAPTEDEGQGL